MQNNNYTANLYYSGVDRTIRVPYTVKNSDGTTFIREVTINGEYAKNG
jgi:hypothetical protein